MACCAVTTGSAAPPDPATTPLPCVGVVAPAGVAASDPLLSPTSTPLPEPDRLLADPLPPPGVVGCTAPLPGPLPAPVLAPGCSPLGGTSTSAHQPRPVLCTEPSKCTTSAWKRLSAGRCAMERNVMPARWHSWYSRISPSALTALVHSSSTAYVGRCHSRRAMASRCFSPPLSVSCQGCTWSQPAPRASRYSSSTAARHLASSASSSGVIATGGSRLDALTKCERSAMLAPVHTARGGKG
mmetsp:Transcript_23150/g.59139  ORF Transcript_23150/g.59139 Transcript_23150/m.59139 type:complete len:241 (+) Transcript_23150:549-1271(+)